MSKVEGNTVERIAAEQAEGSVVEGSVVERRAAEQAEGSVVEGVKDPAIAGN